MNRIFQVSPTHLKMKSSLVKSPKFRRDFISFTRCERVFDLTTPIIKDLLKIVL